MTAEAELVRKYVTKYEEDMIVYDHLKNVCRVSDPDRYELEGTVLYQWVRGHYGDEERSEVHMYRPVMEYRLLLDLHKDLWGHDNRVAYLSASRALRSSMVDDMIKHRYYKE